MDADRIREQGMIVADGRRPRRGGEGMGVGGGDNACCKLYIGEQGSARLLGFPG